MSGFIIRTLKNHHVISLPLIMNKHYIVGKGGKCPKCGMEAR